MFGETRMTRHIYLVCVAIVFVVPQCVSAEVPSGVASFLKANCAACHNSDDKNGNLDFDSLEFVPEVADVFARWVKVFDRVEAGLTKA